MMMSDLMFIHKETACGKMNVCFDMVATGVHYEFNSLANHDVFFKFTKSDWSVNT